MLWQKVDDRCHRGQPAAPEIGGMKEPTDSVDEPENQHESTYGLLIRSEEKGRNMLEMAIYPLLIIGAIIAIWQFVVQPMESPSMNTKGGSVFQGKAANICRVNRPPESNARPRDPEPVGRNMMRLVIAASPALL